ncbi:MAG: hypothetical protein HN348_24950 [Proteobacteria bacterium]|jgi:hypothetical protein|nr:hypothetical protein [Pseudomonadota bacterium]
MANEAHIDPADLIVQAKVRVIIKEAEMRAGDEVWNELGHAVTQCLKAAMRRAKSNGRKTLKACDF